MQHLPRLAQSTWLLLDVAELAQTPANSPQHNQCCSQPSSFGVLFWPNQLTESREARLKAEDLPIFTTTALLSASGVFTSPHV